LNKVCLGEDVIILPSGGGQLPYVAQALHSRRIHFVAALDGDKAGQEMKKRILDLCKIDQSRVVTLDQLNLPITTPTIEDMFSSEFKKKYNVETRGLPRVMADIEEETLSFDDVTLDNFLQAFNLIKEAIGTFQ
jgi:DNA primase